MKRIILPVLILFSLVLATPALAKKTINDAPAALNKAIAPTGLQESNIGSYIGGVLKGAFAVSGVVFFALMVYAGIMWMSAQGKDEQVEKARNTLIGAVIGIVIVVLSYGITNFVQQRVIEGQKSAGPRKADQVGDQPAGCCYDWVAATQAGVATGGIPAWRITTYADCKEFGEKCTENPKDLICGDEGEGYWQFSEGVSAEECMKNLP